METGTQYSSSKIRTISLAVIAGLFFGGVATGVAFPTLPLLDEYLVISAVMISIILASNRIARLFMNTPAGTIIDRYGARKPMIAGLFVQAFAPFGYVLGLYTPAYVLGTIPLIGQVSAPGLVFVLSRLFWGVGSAFVFLGAFAIVTSVTTPSNRGRWIGYMRGGDALGFPTGLIVGGILTDLVDMQAAFLLAGVLALIAGVVALFVLPDVHTGADARSASFREIPVLLRQRPVVVVIGFGNFVLQFLWGGIVLSTLARYAEVYEMELSIPTGGTDPVVLEAAGISGVVMAFGVLTYGVVTVSTGKISDQIDNRMVLTVPAFSAMAAGFLVIAFVPAIEMLFVSMVLLGAGMGAAAPILLTVLGDLTPGEELGRIGGVYNTMGDIGLSLGPLVAIPAVDLWFGYLWTYVLCGALVLSCLFVVSAPLLRNPEGFATPTKAD